MKAFVVLGIVALLATSGNVFLSPTPVATPLPQAPPAGEWQTYHGGYALDGLAEQAPPDAPVELWRYKAGARVHSTPLVAGGRIYTAHSKGGLAALGLDGKELWKAQLGEKELFKAPLIHVAGVLVVASDAGKLFAVEAATGATRWVYNVEDSVQGSANRVELAGGKLGVIVVSQSDGAIHCVALDDGKFQWKTPGVERCDGSPSALGGRVVMGSCASALHVFDVPKAAKALDVEIGGDSQVAGGVAMSGTEAFAGTRNGKLVAVDVAAGKLLWTNADAKKEAFTTPAVNDKLVIFGSDDGKLLGVDRKTGKTLWTSDLGGPPSSPVIAGNRVVVAADGALIVLDLADGKKLSSVEVSDDLTPPAVAGGIVYLGADDGTVSAWGRK